MLRVLYLTDTHLRMRPSRSRIDNLATSLSDKLSEVVKLAEGVDYVVHGGDIFHSHIQSVGVMNMFLDFVTGLPCPIYSLVGNHDVVGRNQNTLNNNLLGLVARIHTSNKLHLLLSGNNQVDLGKFLLYGMSVDPSLDSKREVIVTPKEKPVILVVHNMLVPQSFPSEHVPVKDFKTNADVVLCAHYHPGFPIMKIDGTLFIAPGAFCRLEATQANYERTPQVALLELVGDKFNVQYIPLQSALKGSEVFSAESIQLRTKINEHVAAYVATYVKSLEDNEIQALDLDTLPKLIGERAGFSQDVIEELEKMLRETDI